MKTNNLKTIIFVFAVFLIFFSFAGHTNAQGVGDFISPHAACRFYYGQPGFAIIKDLEHNCLVRSGDSQTGFIYTHFYDSGNNFCLEVTSPSGRIFGPQCMPISQTGRVQQQQQQQRQQQQQGASPKIVTLPSFKIRELQYDHLPVGKPIQSGDNERIEITMPDGALIQLDANSTFTPVSDHEVHSVFGRYRYLWQPFHNGKCIVGQNLVRQDCRKVRTRDAILGARGTEFLVETDKAGTSVWLLKGQLGVVDLNGKKTVELVAGQSTYIKHGGLPEDSQSFDPAKIERWWKKKTFKQTLLWFLGIIIIITIPLSALSLMKEASSKGKKVVPFMELTGAVFSFQCGVFVTIASLSFFPKLFSSVPWLNSLMLFLADWRPLFFIVGVFGLIFGIIGLKSSKKILATFGIILNLIVIFLYWTIK